MAYEMHEWVCNEPITADKLNHMEQGIVEAQNDESSGGDVLIIRQDEEASTSSRRVFDKTWQEVFDALKVGTRVIVLRETELPPSVRTSFAVTTINKTNHPTAPYQVIVTSASLSDNNATVIADLMFADTADGYLYVNMGGNQ